MASIELSNPPVSQFANEPYIMNEGIEATKLKVSLDLSKTPFVRSKGRYEDSDFKRYSKHDIMNNSPRSRKVRM